jgi:HEAT repeat protein
MADTARRRTGIIRRDVILAGHTGDRAMARDALHHVDAPVREAALGALERLGILDTTALEGALEDPHPSVRRRAAELAALHPEVDLAGTLDDPEPTVVESAAWACGEQIEVSQVVMTRLVALATAAEDALVREAAAAALGAIGDDFGLPAILAACNDKPAVRRRAVLALAPFIEDDVDGTVDAAIERALVDRDWQVRQAAEDLRRATAD